MPSWFSLSFQDPATFAMSGLISLHDHILVVMLVIFIFISYIFLYLLFNSFFYKFLSENTLFETIWSILPFLLLIILVIPSMGVLYMVEDFKTPSLTFKVVAHQWYWTYVSPLFMNLSYSSGDFIFSFYEEDSLMDLDSQDSPRLLGCSSDLFLPVNTTSRLLVTSTDVIHSFSSPAMGLKVDAIPGRINQLFVNPSMVGLFFGQCSEICGSNHSFMPISLKVCSLSDFDRITTGFTLELLDSSDLL